MSSAWVSMNVLSLDEKRVIVESQETALMDALRAWGFEPIPCPFRGFNALGGSFHCATVDVRRRGTLQSYFG
jgi:glycine amidinotransferase